MLGAMFHEAVVTNTGFLLYLLGKLSYAATYLVPVLFIPAVLHRNGSTPYQSALALMLMGICNLIGRLIPGLLETCTSSRHLENHATKLLALLDVGSAVAIFAMVSFQDCPEYVYMGCCLHGLCYGPREPLGATCALHFVGNEHDDRFRCALGLDVAIYGLGVMIGKELG